MARTKKPSVEIPSPPKKAPHRLKKKSEIGKELAFTSAHLPLFHILGSMHPVHRMMLISHLDLKTVKALTEATNMVMSTAEKGDNVFPLNLQTRLKAMKKQNARMFKYARGAGSDWSKRRSALSSLGGSVIGLILSTAIPLILGKLLKK